MGDVILTIWVSAWEMDCCQPDAVVGETWSACVLLEPAEPWWYGQSNRSTPPPEVGVVELELDVVRAAPSADGYGLARLGAVSIGVKGAEAVGPQRVRGRLWNQWHGPDPDGLEFEETAVEGVVRRVRRVPIDYQRQIADTRSFMPVGELQPIEAHSTIERRETSLSDPSNHHYHDELLVDLEVAD